MCYTLGVLAGEDDYDGVPYADLVFAEVDWSEATEHIRERSSRTGHADELDIEPEWATAALADPRRLVGSAGSRSRLTVKVLGWSPSAPSRDDPGWLGRLLKVIVAPKDHPPTDDGGEQRRWTPTTPTGNATRRNHDQHPRPVGGRGGRGRSAQG